VLPRRRKPHRRVRAARWWSLYSISQELAGLHELSVAVNEGIRKGAPVPVDVSGEYTGLDRFSSEGYQDALRAMLQEKYRSRRIDLLVLVGSTALEFVVSKGLFPGVPIVTCYVAGRLVEGARGTRPELTGALPAQNAARTIELMLRLYPETRRIHVVLGASAYERGQAEQGKVLFAALAPRVELTYTSDLTLDQLDARVRQLPDSDLVLWGSLLQDASGRNFDTTEPLRRISAASRRPVT